MNEVKVKLINKIFINEMPVITVTVKYLWFFEKTRIYATRIFDGYYGWVNTNNDKVVADPLIYQLDNFLTKKEKKDIETKTTLHI